jgi:hypothetical protein
VNAIFFNATNSLEHELAKAKVCYELLKTKCKFITEAVRNTRFNGMDRRVDVVDLSTGREIEIETNKNRAKRFESEPDIIVIKLFEG